MSNEARSPDAMVWLAWILLLRREAPVVQVARVDVEHPSGDRGGRRNAAAEDHELEGGREQAAGLRRARPRARGAVAGPGPDGACAMVPGFAPSA